MSIHLIVIGLLLGWGAAVPIGPINLEIIRRNLTFGAISGFVFGSGACLADITYFLIFSLSTLTFFSHPIFLKVVGILGAAVLAWFGFSALRMQAKPLHIEKKRNASIIQQISQGYLLTLLNPMTILFWVSVSAQVAALSQENFLAGFSMWLGIVLGVLSWISGINYFLQKTRHRLPKATMHWLNIIGGVILIGFAIIGLWHAIVSS